MKHTTTDRDATGLAAALGIAEALDDMYQRLVSQGRKRGLMTAPQGVLDQAREALRLYDTVPADRDVDVDTLTAVRDSLAALITAQGADVS